MMEAEAASFPEVQPDHRIYEDSIHFFKMKQKR